MKSQLSRLILLAMLWTVFPLPQISGKQPEKSGKITQGNKPERDPCEDARKPQCKPRPERDHTPERQPERREPSDLPGNREPRPCVNPDINPKRDY